MGDFQAKPLTGGMLKRSLSSSSVVHESSRPDTRQMFSVHVRIFSSDDKSGTLVAYDVRRNLDRNYVPDLDEPMGHAYRDDCY